MPWIHGAAVPSPAADEVLVDTGQLPGGQIRLELVAYADNAVDLILERRNADNSARLGNPMLIGLRATWERIPFETLFPSQPNERYRVLARSAMVGTAQINLGWRD